MKNGRPSLSLPIAGAVVCLLLVWQAHAALWDPDFLPGWDGSGYVLRGVRVHDALVAGDTERLGELLLRPDIRPPLFPLLLGLFCLVAGTDISVGTTWAQLCFALSLLALPWIGRRIGAEAGRAQEGLYAGVGAAVLTAAGIDHLALIMTPMSESTTLLCTLLCSAAILLAAQRPGPWAALTVGLALLAAALVRYNLPVMMGVPLVVWWAWEEIRSGESRPIAARLRGAAWAILWFLPTIATFALWSALRPNLGEQIGKFLVNRSSGLEFWSAENLLFFPLALRDSYLGLPGWAVLGLFFLGLPALLPRRAVEIAPAWAGGWSLRLETSPGLRLLQLQGLAAIAALTLHDYKLDRNLYASLPLIYLCALLPLHLQRGASAEDSAKDRGTPRPPWIAAALLLILSGWQAATGVPTLPDRYHMEGDPGIRAALDFLAKLAPRHPRLWVTGTNDSLSPPLIELWLRQYADAEPRLITKSEAQAERTRTGIDPTWNDRYQQVVDEEFLSDKEIARTTYVCIETLPGSRRFRGGQRWTNYQNNYARAFSQQQKIPLLERLTLPEAGIQLSAYAADAPARPRADAPRPAAEIPLPASPFYDEQFQQGGEGWGLFPPTEVPPEGVSRQGMLRVTVVVPTKLQLCGPPIPLPEGLTALTARWEIAAARMEGRAPVLQLRESDPSGAVLKRPDNTARIHRVGPVRLDGAQTLGGPITLEAGTAHLKPCVILEGVTGEFTLSRITLAGSTPPEN